MRKPSQLKRTVKVLRNLTTDIYLGGLYGTVSRPHGWGSHANAVAPTDYGALPYIFGAYQVRPEDVFVDVGCGRGRVIRWWLRQGYTNRLIGVELDEKTASYARAKFSKWHNVEIIQGNIFDHIPPEATVFYCYNPFQREWVEKFRDGLRYSHPETRSPCCTTTVNTLTFSAPIPVGGCRSATYKTPPTGSRTFFTGWPFLSCSRRWETQVALRRSLGTG